MGLKAPPATSDVAEGRTRTATDAVVTEIRELIASGELLPGQRVRQAWLAERLGVSRVPVREALAALTAEGSVTASPNLGFTVARFSEAELRQLFLMRDALELVLIRNIGDIPDGFADQLEQINKAISVAADHNELERCLQLNREFHFACLRLGDMRLVLSQLVQLWNLSETYRSIFFHYRGELHGLSADHEEIIDRARAGDVSGFARAFTDHQQHTMNRLSEALRFGRHPLLAE